ncbi:MAG TPA: penicillin-binding transpeptidase domain-containing protein [Terriglobia bacterium]|nr:penicillin-binding transpeptidase domain-containing protein [Terriglobia bacterium]
MGKAAWLRAIVASFVAVTLAGGSRLEAQKSLQSTLDALTAGRRGSAIAINPASGEILAAWNLRAATEDAYPPGSAAKLVAAAAALEEGLMTPRDRIVCRGAPPLLGPAYHCAHPPALEGFTLSSALANSCNYFFTVVSLRLNAETLIHWYSVFGFGAAVEVDGRPTAPGRVRVAPGARGKALAALGEEDVVATPAQLLEAYALIANRGAAWGLWTGKTAPHGSDPVRRVTLKAATYNTLTEGLVACVQFGTCQAAAVPGVRVAGKTGTATALDGSGATHAWFVAFAPAERPEIALVVFLERGTGAHSAAPLAGKFLRRYFAAERN